MRQDGHLYLTVLLGSRHIWHSFDFGFCFCLAARLLLALLFGLLLKLLLELYLALGCDFLMGVWVVVLRVVSFGGFEVTLGFVGVDDMVY